MDQPAKSTILALWVACQSNRGVFSAQSLMTSILSITRSAKPSRPGGQAVRSGGQAVAAWRPRESARCRCGLATASFGRFHGMPKSQRQQSAGRFTAFYPIRSRNPGSRRTTGALNAACGAHEARSFEALAWRSFSLEPTSEASRVRRSCSSLPGLSRPDENPTRAAPRPREKSRP